MEFRNSGTVSGSNQAYSHTPNVNPIQPTTYFAENSEKLENAIHRTPSTFSPPLSRPIGTPTESKAPSTSSSSPQKQLITSHNYTAIDPFIIPIFPLTSTLPLTSTEPGKLGSPSPPYLLKQLAELGRTNDTPMKSKAPSTSSLFPQNQVITFFNYTVKDPSINPGLPSTSTFSPPLCRPIGTPMESKAPSTSSSSPQKQLITTHNYTVIDPSIIPGFPLTSTLPLISTEPGQLESPSPLSPLKQLVESGRSNDTPIKRNAPSTSSGSPQKQLITSPNYTGKDTSIKLDIPFTSTLTKPSQLGSPSPPSLLKQLVKPGRPKDKPRKRKALSTSSSSPQKQLITSSHYTVKDPSIIPGLPSTSTLTEPEPQEKTPEICLAYIWKRCKLEDKCTNMHYHLPYRWQVQNGSEWKDLPDMEDIERAYSEPGNDSFKTVNFQTMTYDAKPVRRLSTPSSVTQPPTYVLTTEWIWYWRDESDIWIEYGHSNSQKTGSSIVLVDLEKKYVSDPKETFTFTIGTNHYVINFQEMKQENTLFKTKRKICRRPKFLDCKNVQVLKGCTKSAVGNFRQKLPDSPLKTGTFPPEWDINAMPKIGFKKVLLTESSPEFGKIVQMFQKTVLDHMVKRMWRVENSFLWKAYCLQKEEMKTRNAGRDVNELLLFHGTKSKNIDAICNENFDWRVCGTNGTVYGEGSYFARDASYSHTYSSEISSDTLMMIVARVLVGDFIEGDCRMKRPPQKPKSTQRYDSCVNNISNPSIFVVFDKPQIYPLYILEYKKI